MCMCSCMCVYIHTQVYIAPLCPTLCDPMDYSPPGSSVHGILQARILEQAAGPSSKGSSQPRDRTGSPALQVDSLLLSHWGSSLALP